MAAAAAREERLRVEGVPPPAIAIEDVHTNVPNADHHEMKGLPLLYVKGVARCPCLCAIIGFLVAAGVSALGIILFPPQVETDFSRFMKTTGNASSEWDAYTSSLPLRTAERRRLQVELFGENTLSITYEAKDGNNLLTEDALYEIREFEQSLKGLPSYVDHCGRTYVSEDGKDDLQGFCSPGLSFANYVFPMGSDYKNSIVPTRLNFNGKGPDMLPLKWALHQVTQLNLKDVLFPVDFNVNAWPPRSNEVRSVFKFRMMCCQSTDPPAVQKAFVKEHKERWQKLIEGELYDLLSSANLQKVYVFYDGEGVKSHEIMLVLWGDIMFAAGSMAFVLLYMLNHTRSPMLSICGLGVVFLSIPSAYTLFAVMSNSAELTLASFLSLFLIIGLGSDIVFVLTDFWRQSAEMETRLQRLIYTYRNGGAACAATSFTTAASFFANLASVLRALREFGVFMGLCVILAFVFLLAIYPPLCVVDERWCRCSCKKCKIPCTSRRVVESPNKGHRVSNFFYQYWSVFLLRWKKILVSFFIILSLLCIVGACLNAQVSSGIPQMFPEDHNQNRGMKVRNRFHGTSDILAQDMWAPGEVANVCDLGLNFGPKPNVDLTWLATVEACPLFWCEVDKLAIQLESSTECQCFRSETGEAGVCEASIDRVKTATRIVGVEQIPEGMSDVIASHLLKGRTASTGAPPPALKPLVLNPLLAQVWESGELRKQPVVEYQTPTSFLHFTGDQNVDQSKPVCVWKDICYCGSALQCDLGSSWRSSGKLVLPTNRRLLQSNGSGHVPASRLTLDETTELVMSPRLLQGSTGNLVANLRTEVVVVLGMTVNYDGVPLGENVEDKFVFQDHFNPSSPWAQRHILRICEDTPDHLLVVENWCWIKDFRTYLHSKFERFPTTPVAFDQHLGDFASSQVTGIRSSSDFLWLATGRLTACYLAFFVDFPNTAGSRAALEYKDKWDQYIKDWNSFETDMDDVKGAWHASRLWVRAEAEREITASVALTMVIAIVLAFIGMLFFTKDLMLATYVVLSTIGVIGGLAFFMTVIMGWKLGALEIIALIVFVGYSVTFSLHIAHKYSHKHQVDTATGSDVQMRFEKTRLSLKAMGSAIFGSACTTLGSSLFLFFCTMKIFQQLGAVVFMVTFLSLIYALVPLPAGLMWIGPLRPLCSTPAHQIQDLSRRAKEEIVHEEEKVASYCRCW